MKIQSKILVSIAASVAVAATIALIAFSILRGMNTELARSRIYDQIIRKTHALNVLTASVKEGSGQSDIGQVKSILGSLDDLLSKMTYTGPREEALIRQMQRNNRELGPLIDQMFVTGQEVAGGIERERRNVLASQIWMKIGFISDDTDRLNDISLSRIIPAQKKTGATVIALIILLALTSGIIYFLSGRSFMRAQEALRKSEERFRVTLSSIGDAVIATDASGLVDFLNPVAANLTGWESGAASHQPIQNVFRIINEQTREPARNVVEHVLREGNIVNLANHTALITRDGREIPIEDSAAPIRDKEQGGVCGVVLVFHDVTERRRAQEQIRSIARFPDENPNPILRISGEGKLLYANRSSAAFLKSLGWKQGETLPGDWGQHALQTLSSGCSEEMELTCEEVVYSLMLAPVCDMGYLNIYGRDITERKRAETELRENQSRLDLALRSAHMGVWDLDLMENKRRYDNQVCHLLGTDPAEFTGTAEEFFKAVHPDDREMIKAALARTIEQDVPYETEYRAVWPDGSLHYLTSRTKLFRDETGLPVRVNGLIWDITGRKQMEEELRRSRDELELRVCDRTTELSQAVERLASMNEELQEFAFIASHDLQEPLRKIQTFGNILIRKHKESLNPEGQDFMERVTKAANRMSELLRSLLDYSRTGTSHLNYKPVYLTDVAQDAASDLEYMIAKAKGRVEISELPIVDADAALLRQLFQNLIGNAIKYRKESEPPVVKIYGRIRDAMCQVMIEDNGIGFDECYCQKIFKPFERLHGSNSPYTGTGMGLAICKKILNRHGGEITVRSIPGQGATFIVTLPPKQQTGA